MKGNENKADCLFCVAQTILITQYSSTTVSRPNVTSRKRKAEPDAKPPASDRTIVIAATGKWTQLNEVARFVSNNINVNR